MLYTFSPSDVCAESCTASTQLTGLLLLLNLSLKLLLSVDLKASSTSQKATQIHAFLAFLEGLTTKWDGLAQIPSISQIDVNFVIK